MHIHKQHSRTHKTQQYVGREMSSSWQQGEGNWSVLASKECACEGGGRRRRGSIGFAKAGAIWVQEVEGGGVGSIPQLCTDSKKREMCSENPDCSATLLLSHSPFHNFLLQFPPQRHLKVVCLHVCLCLFVCFCLCGSCSTVQSGLWDSCDRCGYSPPP